MSVEFRFLELEHYDNGPHFARFLKVVEARRRECTVLLPTGVQAQALFDIFLERVLHAIDQRCYLPIARFCDGEFSFYSGRETTTCWGERRSNVNVDGVEKLHVDALRLISREGLLCPNLNLSYLKTQSDFLEFLAGREMALRNYAPFYFVYALLVHPRFLESLRNRSVALISNFKNKNLANILSVLESKGISNLTTHEIPGSGVAHGEFLLKIDKRPDIALVGAGIGSPLVLAQLQEKACVAIDSGFVFHLRDGTFDRAERLFLNYE